MPEVDDAEAVTELAGCEDVGGATEEDGGAEEE